MDYLSIKPDSNRMEEIPRNRLYRLRSTPARAFLVSFLAILLISAALLSAGKSRAQENGISGSSALTGGSVEIVVRAGFGRLEVSNWVGSWVPFRISLANHGPPVTGRLIVHCESNPNPNPQVREYVKEIQLPTGSRQFHEVAAFLNSGEGPLVQIQVDDQVIAETKVNVERSYGLSDQLEIAVVDADSTTLNNISSAEIIRAPNRAPFKSAARSADQQPSEVQNVPVVPPPLPQNPQSRRGRPGAAGGSRPVFVAHPTVIPTEDLPRDYIAYDQLDAVVLGDAPLNQLTEEQARALRLWVASGGLLVVTGAADIVGLSTIGLESLLPVSPEATATSDSLNELNEVYGAFESADRLVITSARLKPDAKLLIGSGDKPIVAEKNYGSGLVRFVSINPKINPYRGWSAAKDLWADLLLPAAESKPKHTNWITFGRRGNSSSSRWGAQSFLFRLAEIEPPSPRYVLLFLLAYVLILGPINYLVLRWRRKTDLAWLTIPGIVISFAIVSVTVAQIGRGGASRISDASLVELHQRDGISRVSAGLLMMPATKRTQEVSFNGRHTYVNDVYQGNQTSSASALGTIECERRPGEFILRVPMTTWTSGLFQLRSINEGEQALVSASSNDTSVLIRNLGDAEISKAVYLSSEGVSDLFDIAAHSEQRISVSAPQPSTFNGWYLTELGESSHEADLFQELAALLDREVGGNGAFTQGFFGTQLMPQAIGRLERPLLIAFLDKAPTEIGFQGSLRRNSKALYVVHL